LKTGECLICWAQFHGFSQELLLSEFGAVKIWQAQAKHDGEGHELQEVKAE